MNRARLIITFIVGAVFTPFAHAQNLSDEQNFASQISGVFQLCNANLRSASISDAKRECEKAKSLANEKVASISSSSFSPQAYLNVSGATADTMIGLRLANDGQKGQSCKIFKQAYDQLLSSPQQSQTSPVGGGIQNLANKLYPKLNQCGPEYLDQIPSNTTIEKNENVKKDCDATAGDFKDMLSRRTDKTLAKLAELETVKVCGLGLRNLTPPVFDEAQFQSQPETLNHVRIVRSEIVFSAGDASFNNDLGLKPTPEQCESLFLYAEEQLNDITIPVHPLVFQRVINVKKKLEPFFAQCR